MYKGETPRLGGGSFIVFFWSTFRDILPIGLYDVVNLSAVVI